MTWQAGDRVRVRGADWRVIRSIPFSDCEALDLAAERWPISRTLLLPFDHPRSPSIPRLQVVKHRRWATEAAATLQTSYPFGGLRHCPPAIQLLPFQLEPALAVFRHGFLRVLIGDDVGLGKTVEGGVILREVVMREHQARCLIVLPAAVCMQWVDELSALFGVAAVVADAPWLRRRAQELPADVNPWSLPGVFVASIDFVKRPEVLHPLESLHWDLVIVDEAHNATPGSDRRAAVHSLACMSRVVVLLTATPHLGDEDQFSSLCRLGAETGRPPIATFSRSRSDTPLAGGEPRSRMLPVRLTEAEARTQRMLEEYTGRVWSQSRQRSSSSGQLVATILRKRALSSAAAVSRSIGRRLELLGAAEHVPAQLELPLKEDGVVEGDEVCDAVMGAAGLSDEAVERSWLTAIADASVAAQQDESKVRVLLRLLRRIREPAIVFTEYRDTAERLERALEGAGHRVAVLHGGMPARERREAVAAFSAGGRVMVATDAASEGLNLHHACRLVVHFELPWTPARLHQRCGRVNRIGQTRRVHEIALVARDTSEQLVLLPLVRRARQSGGFVRGALVQRITETQVAAHVLGGAPLDREAADASCPSIPAGTQRVDLRTEAEEEACRLQLLRTVGTWSGPGRAGARDRSGGLVPITSIRARAAVLPGRMTVLVVVTIAGGNGERLEQAPIALSLDCDGPAWAKAPAALAAQIEQVLARVHGPIVGVLSGIIETRVADVGAAYRRVAAALRARDAARASRSRSAARELVQAGLFDRRALRLRIERDRSRQILLEDLAARGTKDDRVHGSFEVRAVLVRRR